MPVYADLNDDGTITPVLNADGTLMIFDEFAPCDDCGEEEAWCDMHCDQPGCHGYQCVHCGAGCDHTD